jgi:hypothetical protein
MNMADRYEFMSVVSDIFEQCKSEEEIEKRRLIMIRDIKQQCELCKGYLKAGILNVKEGEYTCEI